VKRRAERCYLITFPPRHDPSATDQNRPTLQSPCHSGTRSKVCVNFSEARGQLAFARLQRRSPRLGLSFTAWYPKNAVPGVLMALGPTLFRRLSWQCAPVCGRRGPPNYFFVFLKRLIPSSMLSIASAAFEMPRMVTSWPAKAGYSTKNDLMRSSSCFGRSAIS
jgi:hypothetical protein